MPGYIEIAAALAGEIASLPSETRLSSERELAARFGVSRTTLRNALALLEERGQLHRCRRTLLSGSGPGRSRVLFFHGGASVPGYVYGLSGLLAAAGTGLELLAAADPGTVMDSALASEAETVVIAGSGFSPHAIKQLGSGRRVVLCDQNLPAHVRNGCDTLDCDFFQWGYMAGRFLAGRGCRRPGLLTAAGTPDELRSGFVMALDEARLRSEPSLLRGGVGDSVGSGFEELARWNELGMPDGAAVSAPALATGVLLALLAQPEGGYWPLVMPRCEEAYAVELYPAEPLYFDPQRRQKLLGELILRRRRGGVKHLRISPSFAAGS